MEKVLARLDDHDLILGSVLLEAYRAVCIEAGDERPSDLFVPLSFNFGFGQVWPVSLIIPEPLTRILKTIINFILEVLEDSIYISHSKLLKTILLIDFRAIVSQQLMLVIYDSLIHFSLQEEVNEVGSGWESDTNILVLRPLFSHIRL